VAAAVAGRPVVRPAGPVGGRHWAVVGGAFGVRLAALVEPAPPYYALLGLLRTGLVSPGWANEQAARYPSHGGLPASARPRALSLRPTPAGWLELDGLTDVGGARAGASRC